MAVTLGILALLEAQTGKGEDVAAFLRSGRAIVEREEGTITWYAFKVDDTTYGIFDTFESEDARLAHLNGEIPRALAQVGPDLLASDPTSAQSRCSPPNRASLRGPRRQRASAFTGVRSARGPGPRLDCPKR